MSGFGCEQCGANLKFQPGTTALKCPYCGYLNPIPETALGRIREHDYQDFLERAQATEQLVEVITVKCPSCAAETTFDPNVSSSNCPFCSTGLVQTTQSQKQIKPEAVLPFQVGRKEALGAFRTWLGSLWFAPNKLQKAARHEEELNGVYLPFWTYDTQTTTHYTGRRGEYYYETQYVTVRDSNGNTRQEARQVQKIHWYPASGTVFNAFDDVLVCASDTLPVRHTENLEPWDLSALIPYQDAFLQGFRAESYHISLEEGLEQAKRRMHPIIEATICRDIGGDVQDVTSTRTQYQNITFKHILLPLWISAYRYSGRVYRFVVNGRSGEVQGERPYSWVKITFAIIACISFATLLYFLFSYR
ncbi:MAG TPA: hypothetical protein PLL64_11595 [Rhodothermales bacterium]|nr:hypothetical protein [Rhodothermales bacterium]HRR09348.1 hypothetical protein [Rhodothermales bacterium]